MAVTLSSPALLTADEYAQLPGDGRITELVRGRRVDLNRPYTEHGYLMLRLARRMADFVDRHDLGRIAAGDAGVITTTNPDTVRGPDIAFYSYDRVPRGPRPKGYWPSPDLAVEIRSPSDRWPDTYAKISEYLEAGVLCVLIVDPIMKQVQASTSNEPMVTWSSGDEVTLTIGLPGFTIPVDRIFD